MISIRNFMYELKQNISDEDIMAFKDFDDFVKTNAENYLAMRLDSRRYQEHIIKGIPISDYHGEIPKYAEIIQVAGSDNKELRYDAMENFFLDTEVAAVMKRDHQDNVFVVHKKKGDCADNCDTELIMNANIFADELAKGTEYSLIRQTYSDYSVDEEGYCRSGLNRKFYLMRPTESAWHGLEGQFIPDCLNFKISDKKQKYDFSIISGRGSGNKKIKTNFKEGVVLMSFYGRIYDDEGYLMIPDDKPNLLEAISYFIQHKVFRKLTNQYKTSDYKDREQSSFEYFRMFNDEAIKELNRYTYFELAPIIARAKYHHHVPKTYEHLMNRDSPDNFQRSLNELHDY